jgi:hypothetical protein
MINASKGLVVFPYDTNLGKPMVNVKVSALSSKE